MPTSASAQQPASIDAKPQFLVHQRVALSPAEFAGLFGRSETWGYRQLYSGRVKAIQVSGRLLIPRSEVDRLLAEAAVYTGVPERAPHRVVKPGSSAGKAGRNPLPVA